MHYWNQENFEGLAAIGAKFAAEEDFAHYSSYCLLREKGLRKQALDAASLFLKHLKSIDVVAQRDIAVRLHDLQRMNTQVHQLLPQPIYAELLNICRSWCDDSPHEVLPNLRLAMLSGKFDQYETILRMDPDEQTALAWMADYQLHQVDYQTHHLSESILLGKLEDANESLHLSKSFIDRMKVSPQRKTLEKEWEDYRHLLTEWTVYSEAYRREGFPEWSRARGNAFPFSTIIYYKK